MDLKEVLSNLSLIARETKLTMDEHMYIQGGLKEISDKLEELDKLKAAAPQQDEKKEDK